MAERNSTQASKERTERYRSYSLFALADIIDGSVSEIKEQIEKMSSVACCAEVRAAEGNDAVSRYAFMAISDLGAEMSALYQIIELCEEIKRRGGDEVPA